MLPHGAWGDELLNLGFGSLVDSTILSPAIMMKHDVERNRWGATNTMQKNNEVLCTFFAKRKDIIIFP